MIGGGEDLIKCFFTAMLIVLVFTSGCFSMNEKSNISLNNTPTTIRDIAYNIDKSHGYKVYIKEGDEYFPYLVLTDDYNGNCLLLRENLLDDPMRFNPNGRFSAYYENSEIDKHLNNEFLDTLSREARNKIADSEIVITANESLGVCGTETKTIIRKIFLLSYGELGGIQPSTDLAEGKNLSYFRSNESRIAKFSSNEVASWWLRTPNTWYDNVVCGVSIDGVIGIAGVGGPGCDNVNGIRPAFCVSPSTKIKKDGDYYRFE